MLNDAQRKKVYSDLPSSFNMYGATVNATKLYSNQYHMDVFPTITLQYTSQSELADEPLQLVNSKGLETVEMYLFETGVLSYELLVPDAKTIVSVEAIRNGTKTTFPSSKYAVSGATLQTLTFTDLTYLPDAETFFTVKYTHDLVRITYRFELFDRLLVQVYAQDQEINNVKQPATKIAQQIANKLHMYFKATFYDKFSEDWDMIPKTVSDILNADDLIMETTRARREFNVDIHHTVFMHKFVSTFQTVNVGLQVSPGDPELVESVSFSVTID